MQTHALPALRLRPLDSRLPARGNPPPRRRQAGPGDGGRAATRLDAQAQPALLRRARLVALAAGGFLLPLCAVLAVTLPATAQAQHWAMAWTGLDAAEAAAALTTAVLLGRGDSRASLPAAAAGTLLLVDAWFDVCTAAPGAGHAMALAEAGCVEIPLAAAAWWLAIVLTAEAR
ncbi:MAG TPA: hypothetical protein VH021_21990 [Trebonia sp.]|jgi:hypothetical protein|nr:hypothetical protein [Trebonia sp.]